MNTATFQETQAVATGSTAAAMAASQELLLIPLSRLRPSSRNVRKSGGTSIPELASSIARVGLLQKPHRGGRAMQGRPSTLKLMVKRSKLAKVYEAFCLLAHQIRHLRYSPMEFGRRVEL